MTVQKHDGLFRKTADHSARIRNLPDPFQVKLSVFDGPFDLLLNLVGKHELDITEVSLSLVTDEFIAYLAHLEGQGVIELDRASEFLVVAATLLDLKIASLLPQGEVVDAEEVALLEARDLLFARLLQYRAFKEASSWFHDQLSNENRRHARSVSLEPKYREKKSDSRIHIDLSEFAVLASKAIAPKTQQIVEFEHLHAPLVSIREQAAVVVAILQSRIALTFRELISGETERGVVVARFLAVLELYRLEALGFEQTEPLGELVLRWISLNWSDEQLSTLGREYD